MAVLKRAGAGVLAMVAFGSASVPAQDRPVGWVVQAAPKVTGRLANYSAELRKLSEVFRGMEVETAANAGARIAINPGLQQEGTVILGPGTIVELTEHLINQTLGLEKMSWLLKLGQLRLALRPPPPGAPLRAGEYTIMTPDKTEIRLQGTDVAVRVDRDGAATVWVLEGQVMIETPGLGGPVLVRTGQLTHVQPGRGPEPPVAFGSTDLPRPGRSPHPGELIFPDPPALNVEPLRLDLP